MKPSVTSFKLDAETKRGQHRAHDPRLSFVHQSSTCEKVVPLRCERFSLEERCFVSCHRWSENEGDQIARPLRRSGNASAQYQDRQAGRQAGRQAE